VRVRESIARAREKRLCVRLCQYVNMPPWMQGDEAMNISCRIERHFWEAQLTFSLRSPSPLSAYCYCCHALQHAFCLAFRKPRSTSQTLEGWNLHPDVLRRMIKTEWHICTLGSDLLGQQGIHHTVVAWWSTASHDARSHHAMEVWSRARNRATPTPANGFKYTRPSFKCTRPSLLN
jgi:hypothetical protein